MLKRPASTISRELRRNGSAEEYSSTQAQQIYRRRRRQSRPNPKLNVDSVFFGIVQHFLKRGWSPEQIALAQAALYPKGHEYRVSHETNYNCIYAQPVGELKRELISCLRQAKNKRLPRSKGQDRRGQIPDMLSIHI
jgi:IS30 family transposase